MKKVLVVTRDTSGDLERLVQSEGYATLTATTREEALSKLGDADLVILEIVTEGAHSGSEWGFQEYCDEADRFAAEHLLPQGTKFAWMAAHFGTLSSRPKHPGEFTWKLTDNWEVLRAPLLAALPLG